MEDQLRSCVVHGFCRCYCPDRAFPSLGNTVMLIDIGQVIVATRKSYITGVSPELAHQLFTQNGTPNPVYRHHASCVASAVILWPGMVATFARFVALLLHCFSFKYHGNVLTIHSTYIMWKSHQHDDIYGPRATAYRISKSDEIGSVDLETSKGSSPPNNTPNASVVAPDAKVVNPGRTEPAPYAGT